MVSCFFFGNKELLIFTRFLFQSFPVLNQLQRHQRTHIDYRRYHCPICRKRFLIQGHLDHHKCQPLHRHVYKCHVCSATFLRILSLANHIYEQHPKVVRARRLKCQQNLKGSQKKSRYKVPDAENGDDSKILLKITLGKSMTIISPSKNTPSASESKRKSPKKKAKKKHRKDEKRQEKKGIILSIKKGMVNVTDKRNSDSKLKQVGSKTKLTEKMNGLVNTEYKLGEQKSELKLTIKACPDLTVSPSRGETYKVLEKSDSKSSLKLEKKSSRTEIDSMENLGIGSQSPLASKDDVESKVRNGIVITKDKTGKLLAEQLPAVKLKKRDNVFDDIGIWKVMASPRDRPNDILKLKLSPQKPARIESTLEDACAYSASKYLDIPVNSVKVKGEVSGEDSDILELLPAYDKESDNGINNVNDSGIEVLSSSSCNRSNGNSVRSVVMEDNSPTYFNTEDSFLSLDSPLTEVLNKSEHSICHKCGGVIMETNNNTRSPGKCRCTVSNPHSPFEMPISPVKTSLLSSEASEALATVGSEHQTNASKLEYNNNKGSGDDDKVLKENVDQEKSDGEDSDIMIITFDKNQNSPEMGKSRLKLKLRPKDHTKSTVNGGNEVLGSSAKRKLNQPISPRKHDKSKSAEGRKTESANDKNDIDADIEDVLGNENQKKDSIESYNKSLDGNNSKNNETYDNAVVKVVALEGEINKSPAVEDNEISVKSDNTASSAPIEHSKQSRKKPLFKSKKSATKDTTNSSSLKLTDDLKQSKESKCVANDEKTVQKKKPLFKKRALSVDENSGKNTKKSCVTQLSVPGQSTGDNMLSDEINRNESASKLADSVHNDKLIGKQNDSSLDSNVLENKTVETNHIPTKMPVSKLRTIGFDEEDSLLDLSTDVIEEEKVSKPTEKSQKPAVSFDLYQQQFLSFISSTMSGSRLDKKKLEGNSETLAKEKMEIEEDEKEIQKNDVGKVSIDDNQSNNKEESETSKIKSKDLRSKKDDNCRIFEIKNKTDSKVKSCEKDSKTDSNIKNENDAVSEEDIVEIKSNKTSKKIKKRLSKSKISFEKKVSNSNSEKVDKDQEAEIEKKVTVPEKKIEKSDSLSWLTIFGDSASKGKSQKTDTDTAVDVMADLSENLAEINKKIDVSEDDDSNSLDVDDVFQVKNLSSLQPKHEINFRTSQAKICAKEKTVDSEKVGSNPPYRRRQTAKRTVGKFKSAKRKIDSENECSVESSDAETIDMLSSHPGSDPDFNPFNDSDDDFMKAPRKRRQSRTCSAKRRTCNGSDSSDSDNESKCSEVDKLETESQSSRSKRIKKGRKSCCPCCIGSPGKRFRDHGDDQLPILQTDAYKLPRRHKQFVRSTLKLLQLQEKIHTLFLTLFPECAEMITHSNIGTEEFESLIDDVLSGLEDKDAQCSSLPHSVTYMKKDIEGQFESCPVSNIEMPFAASGLATRTSEIDLVNTSGDDRSPTDASLVKTVNHQSHSHVDLGTSSVLMGDDNYEHNTAGKEFEAGMIWQHTSLFNQTSLAASTASSTRLKFENNTLTDNDEPMEESVLENVISHPSTVHDSSLAYSQESVAVPITSAHYSAVSQVDILNLNSLPHHNVLDHSEPFDNVDYYTPELDSDPGVQSEITITLDLNAARVSLCRSPKNCLQRLQNQIIKLTKCFFPKLDFKSYFYRNIDNLEFLLDLMIEANSKEIPGDLESDNEVLEESVAEKWHHEPLHELDIVETPLIKEDDTVKVNFIGLKNDIKTEEREPLFVKCSELFEKEIKLQRESLKKDMFSVEEDKTEDTWKKAEEVLHSISSLKKMARETEMAQRTRRPRDCRLRKRSADEKRTLFVQEKLQNSQNSTFVCDTKTRSKVKGKAGRKSRVVNSKKRFLSGLNLVNNGTENENAKLDDNSVEDAQKSQVLTMENENETKNKLNSAGISEKTGSVSDQTVENNSKAKNEAIDLPEDTDCSVKAGIKNIFELMQPS